MDKNKKTKKKTLEQRIADLEKEVAELKKNDTFKWPPIFPQPWQPAQPYQPYPPYPGTPGYPVVWCMNTSNHPTNDDRNV
jgi:hypothetical protein